MPPESHTNTIVAGCRIPVVAVQISKLISSLSSMKCGHTMTQLNFQSFILKSRSCLTDTARQRDEKMNVCVCVGFIGLYRFSYGVILNYRRTLFKANHAKLMPSNAWKTQNNDTKLKTKGKMEHKFTSSPWKHGFRYPITSSGCSRREKKPKRLEIQNGNDMRERRTIADYTLEHFYIIIGIMKMNSETYLRSFALTCARVSSRSYTLMQACELRKHQRMHNDRAMPPLPPTSPICHAMSCERESENRANTQNKWVQFTVHRKRGVCARASHAATQMKIPRGRQDAMHRITMKTLNIVRAASRKMKHSTEIPRDYVLSRTRTLPHNTSLAKFFLSFYRLSFSSARLKRNVCETATMNRYLIDATATTNNSAICDEKRKFQIPNTKFNNGIMQNVNWCECMLMFGNFINFTFLWTQKVLQSER